MTIRAEPSAGSNVPRLKIAMLQCELPPATAGGVGHQVHLLAAALSRRNHEVTVFVTHVPSEGTGYQAVKVFMPRDGRLYRQIGVARAYAKLDLSNFDVVHAHGDDWLVRGYPRVRTFYGTALLEARAATSWLRRGSQLCNYPLEWLSSLRAPSVAISRNTRRYLPLVHRCIPCAFDPETIFPGGEKTAEPSMLFVAGTLAGRKRGNLLLEAFASVRRALPKAELTIVSCDRVDEPGVTCLSRISARRLADLYRTHWLLCSTSSYEGFGVPYVEALASGLPVVTTSNPGASEILEGGKLGVMCDPEHLAPTLVAVLGDGIRRTELARRGISVSRRYSVDVVANQYEHLYRKVIADHEHPEPRTAG